MSNAKRVAVARGAKKGVKPRIVRRSITIDVELDRKAHELARGADFSSYVSEALRRRIQQDRILAFLDQLDREHGPVSPKIAAEARAEWQRLHG
jgi:hypothetical protein